MKTKSFSLSSASLLVVANCVGTGIFTTTGFLLRDLQSPLVVMVVWCLAALYALLGVRCYQELHRLYPGSGGEYHFLHEGFHPTLGKLAGFVSLVAGFSAPIAASAVGFALYFQQFSQSLISPLFLATLLILLVALLQWFYPGIFLRLHNLFVIGKLTGLVALILLAFSIGKWQWPTWSGPFSISAVAHSFFWCAYAFTGWNAVYYIAAEVLDDDDQVHKASQYGAWGVVVLYLSLNVALLFGGDVLAMAGRPEVVAVFLERALGTSVSRWLALFIAFGLISTTSALFITGPRVYARMAQDGALPRLFFATPGTIPKMSLLLQTIVSLFIVWFMSFDKILHTTGFILSLCSALAVSVVVWQQKPNRVLFWAALLFCSATLWLVIAQFF